MPVHCECSLKDTEGNDIQNKKALKYLGGKIAADCLIDAELNQRIGLAEQDFKSLQQVWRHSRLNKWEKYTFT